MELYGEKVVYHSTPLVEDTVVAGEPRLSVWLSMDVPDIDLAAILYEIKADGQSVELADAVLRARYRESLSTAKLVPAGAVLRYDFDFNFFARRLAKGSRVRLVFGALHSSEFAQNYCSGGDVAHETVKDARTAHVRLYHDEAHPSTVELPIAK
jgi:putative CocE/NonD family hydrolase